MSDTDVLQIVSQALMMATKLGAPILLTALVIGVFVSLIQAVTQVQEMTLSFVPKLIGIGVVVLVAGNWMLREFVAWVQALWATLPTIS
jgi:flagellar biosynthetic protein FliQ